MPRKQKDRTRWVEWLVAAILILGFGVIRLPALGSFVTTDEALWLRRSANFYLAISNGDWASTFQTEHPGIVTQWAGAAGYSLKFPSYSAIGEPEVHDAELLRLMENRGVNPMEVLAAGRLVLVLIHTAAFSAAWIFARRLLGLPTAALGMALITFDPFLVAHQRLLHLDGLLASFMLLAVIAFIDFLQTRKSASLVVSAIATGLTMLTKTPGWFLLPFAGMLVAWQLWNEGKKRNWKFWIRSYAIWVVSALLIVFALFPALWLAPLQTLQQMFAYALGSAQGEFSGPLFFNGVIFPTGDFGAAGFIFYPIAFLWRSTPLTLIGLGLAIYFVLRDRKALSRLMNWPVIARLLLFAVLFMAFMTLADKKFDRYLLPALPALLLVAGWGWGQLAQILQTKRNQQRAVALSIAVGMLQLASALSSRPYYLSYYNPVLGDGIAAAQTMQVGWGEGLDQAASYLKQQPAGTVAAWYSTAFNLMFNGKADDIPILTQLPQSQLEDLMAHDYLVIYIHQWQRGTPQNLLDALRDLDPEHVITIDGIEYVRIYHLEH